MNSSVLIALLFAACCGSLLGACGPDHQSPAIDGGAANDAGAASDGGQPDAGADAGTSDAGTDDAGTNDAGTNDAGTNDAGTNDAGTDDAGTNDAGASDAGTDDAGASDAGDGGDGSCAAAADYGAVDPSATEAATYQSADGLYDYTADLNAAAAPDVLHMQLWSGFGVFANGVVPGTYAIRGGETQYATCGLCLLITTGAGAAGTPASTYLATGGTVVITQVTPTLIGTLTDVTFTHVTLDAAGNSTPAGDGCDAKIDALAFDAPVSSGVSCTASADYGTVDPSASETATYDANYDLYEYSADLNSDPDQLDMQLYDGVGVFANGVVPGTYTLSGGELNYATCGLCILIYTNNNSGDVYLATGGTVTITQVTPTLIGALADVTFDHVTIDPTTYQSTPVGDGCDSEIESLAFSAADAVSSRRPSALLRRAQW